MTHYDYSLKSNEHILTLYGHSVTSYNQSLTTHGQSVTMRSEYFHTSQWNKVIKINVLINLQKFKSNTFKLFLHIFTSQNMQKKHNFKILTCVHAHNLIVISIAWWKYFYSPVKAKSVSIISKILKRGVLETSNE